MSSPTPQAISIHHRRDMSTTTLHYLPCKVSCEVEGGAAKEPTAEKGRRMAEVDCYFEPVIRGGSGSANIGGESHQVLTATFRGRQLKGVEVSIPEGYRGVVLREQGTVAHDSQGRQFVMRSHFDKFKLWNLQNRPTADDKVVQALTWTQLSQSLHSPLPLDS